MVRVKRGVTKRKRHKKILKANKGYEHARGKLIRIAHDAYWKSGKYAFAGRRKRRGDMRRKWILKINAALKPFDVSYSRFIKMLSDKKILLNRKALAELSVREPDIFKQIVEIAKK